MANKIHYFTRYARDITDEYYANSACGFDSNSKSDWVGTKEVEKVTCKRCVNFLIANKLVPNENN